MIAMPGCQANELRCFKLSLNILNTIYRLKVFQLSKRANLDEKFAIDAFKTGLKFKFFLNRH